MLVVRVELWSAITGRRTEIARATICNTGETENPNRGDYTAATFKGRDAAALQNNMERFFRSTDGAEANKGVSHKGSVNNHARLQEHVWNLVAKSLAAMGYKTA